MSTPDYAITPSLFNAPPPATFIAATGTAAKVVVDQLPAVAATATSPQLYGGGTVVDLVATSTDAAAKDVQLYLGTVATTQSSTVTGSVSTTSTGRTTAFSRPITRAASIAEPKVRTSTPL